MVGVIVLLVEGPTGVGHQDSALVIEKVNQIVLIMQEVDLLLAQKIKFTSLDLVGAQLKVTCDEHLRSMGQLTRLTSRMEEALDLS